MAPALLNDIHNDDTYSTYYIENTWWILSMVKPQVFDPSVMLEMFL
jgi:hypothetical protein